MSLAQSSVSWAHRTTIKAAAGETSLSLASGDEAVMPVEMIVQLARYYNSKVKQRDFKSSDSVLKRFILSTKEQVSGTLRPT